MCELGHENWINQAIGASVFIVKDDTVLYGVRSTNPGKGKLDRPGGFVDVGETAEQAAIRETKEEMGVDIVLIDFLGSYTATYDGRPNLNLAFIGKITDGKITPNDDMNGGDPVWRKVDDLPNTEEQAADWFEESQKDFVEWWHSHKDQSYMF